MAYPKAMLVQLKDLGRTVADPADDVRGRKVKTTEGEDLGTADALLADVDEAKVRLLRVSHGGIMGLGATQSYIPVEAVAEVKEDEVVVDLGKERLEGAPRYDPVLTDERGYGRFYEDYGYSPFLGSESGYPDYTAIDEERRGRYRKGAE